MAAGIVDSVLAKAWGWQHGPHAARFGFRCRIVSMAWRCAGTVVGRLCADTLASRFAVASAVFRGKDNWLRGRAATAGAREFARSGVCASVHGVAGRGRYRQQRRIAGRQRLAAHPGR